MGNLITFSFWFNSRPGFFLKPMQYTFIAIIIIFFLSAIFFIFLKKKKNVNRKILSSLSSFGFANCFIGALLLFFAFEDLPVLSARFWLALWFAVMAIWGFFIFKQYKKYQIKKEEQLKELEYKKYIP
jgi:uncharacterized membrane protein YfcA